MIDTIAFTLNRQPVSLRVDGDRPLLWVLRTDLGPTGARFGRGERLCGACTVLINNEAVPARQTSVSAVAGSDVKTIDGLAGGGQLHPIQEAFVAHDALHADFASLFRCRATGPGAH